MEINNKRMNWKEYLEIFEAFENQSIVNPFNYTEGQIAYTALNKKRQARWLKKLELDDDTLDFFRALPQQHWVIITEAWCGDSAHILPVLYKLSQLNEKISLTVEFRDNGDLIDKYLTNGGKAIPKVIVRDKDGKDICTYGPRPFSLAKLIPEWKAELSKDDFNKNVQMWYNKNKGKAVIADMVSLLS